MTDGVALNGKSLSEVAAGHKALFSGQPSAYDGINEFNAMLKDAMRQHLQGDAQAVDTFRDALKQRSMLLSSPEVKASDEAHSYLQGIVVTADDPADALNQTVAMHGYVDDPTYKGEAPAADAGEGVEEAKPLL